VRSTTTTIPERIEVLRTSPDPFIPSSDVVDLLLDLRNDPSTTAPTPFIDGLLGSVSYRHIISSDEVRQMLDGLAVEGLRRASLSAGRLDRR
jgi:hypothetical protein